VALPDAFFAFDGMVETLLHVVAEMGVYEAVIRNDLERYLPFLATTTLLMEAVQAGAGREQAHEAIRQHAVAVALEMREEGLSRNDLAERLGADPHFPLDLERVREVIRQSSELVGTAGRQVDRFVERVHELGRAYPQAAAVRPGRLL
jgi:adenylosuccinate lyase